jgi:hypothetical protein
MRQTFRQWLTVAAAAILAGLIANSVGLPAAWLVGPMLAASALTLSGRVALTPPPQLMTVAIAIIGMALSASFTPSSLETIAHAWAPMLAAVTAVLGLTLISAFTLARLCGIDRTTALLGTLPGGASGMVAISEEMQADVRIVAFMQYVRLTLVIVIATLLARIVIGPAESSVLAAAPTHAVGWEQYLLTTVMAFGGAWIGVRLGIPAGALVGPVVAGVALGAFGIPHGTWPPGVLWASNVLIGALVGLRFDAAALRMIGRLAPAILIQMLLLIAGCALIGAMLASTTGVDWLSAYLATTPGGIDSVTIAALDTNSETALVLTLHLLRLLVIVLIGPLIVRRLARTAVEGVGVGN